MKPKRKIMFLFILLFLFFNGGVSIHPGVSQETDEEIIAKYEEIMGDTKAQTLTGIEAFSLVYGEYKTEQLEKVGLNFEQIRAAVTEQLRKTGIKVWSEKKFDEESLAIASGKRDIQTPPYVVFIISIMGNAFFVRLEVRDSVSIDRLIPPPGTKSEPGFPHSMQGVIWDVSVLGTPANEGNYIMMNLERLVDKLIIDYLKFNKLYK